MLLWLAKFEVGERSKMKMKQKRTCGKEGKDMEVGGYECEW